MHIADPEIRKEAFEFAAAEIAFDLDELLPKVLILRQFVVSPKGSGDVVIPGAHYTYEQKDSDTGLPETYKGVGTETEIKIVPYVSYRLISAWGVHEYLGFIIAFLPLALLPASLWLCVYLGHRKTAAHAAESAAGKAKAKVTAAGKHKKK